MGEKQAGKQPRLWLALLKLFKWTVLLYGIMFLAEVGYARLSGDHRPNGKCTHMHIEQCRGNHFNTVYALLWQLKGSKWK